MRTVLPHHKTGLVVNESCTMGGNDGSAFGLPASRREDRVAYLPLALHDQPNLLTNPFARGG